MASPTTISDRAERITAALVQHTGASAAQLSVALGLARSSTGKALVALESAGRVVREPGGRDGAQRVPDRWFAAAQAAGARTVPASGSLDGGSRRSPGEEAMSAPTAPDAKPERLSRGALSGLVLAVLDEHKGEHLGPITIARLLERSSGAVTNALLRLEASGEVEETSSTPRRYRRICP